MSLLNRRMMLNSMREKIILIKTDALEQGTINANDGLNFQSNYRVRTKNFIDIEKGKYEITCEGAKQGNVLEYDTDRTWKKVFLLFTNCFQFI